MLFVGKGRELWHCRVDLIAPDDDGRRVSRAAQGLRPLLRGENTGPGHGYGVDQGKGDEGQPVLGLTFWVKADEVGPAASTALATARQAGASADAGPEYYNVTLVPRSAILMRADDHAIDMAD